MSKAWGPHAHPERCEEEWTRLRHEDDWCTWIAIGAFGLAVLMGVLFYEGYVKRFWVWLGMA